MGGGVGGVPNSEVRSGSTLSANASSLIYKCKAD